MVRSGEVTFIKQGGWYDNENKVQKRTTGDKCG